MYKRVEEEVVNVLTHLCAFFLVIVVMVVFARLIRHWGQTSSYHKWGYGIFTSSWITLYSASTAYHSFSLFLSSTSIILRIFQFADHCSVYIMIAGSYTPLVLIILLRTGRSLLAGKVLLATVWSAAVAGVILKIGVMFFGFKISAGFDGVLFLIMGTIVFFPSFFIPTIKYVPKQALYLVIFGGGCYTVGLYFFLWDTMIFNHGVWHLFALAGSFLHFLSVLVCSLPSHCSKYGVWTTFCNILREKIPPLEVEGTKSQ